MSIHEQQNSRLNDGKTCRPKQDAPTGDTHPEKKTQKGNHAAEEIGSKMELSTAQPLKLIRGLGSRNGFGTSDQWGGIETALLARIVGEQWALPNAHRQDALLHLTDYRAKFKGLHRLRNVPDGVRGHLS